MTNRLTTLALTVLVLAACNAKKAESTSTPLVDSVEVFALKKEAVIKTLSLPAELYPWERAEVYAKMEGYVLALKVDIGDNVRKNDILLILDAPELTANYARSMADLQAAQADFHTSRDLYKRTLNAGKEKGTVSESEMERIKNQMLSDSATFEAARSGTNAYEQLKNYLIIRASFDGVITQRNVDPGTLVGKEQKPMIVLENVSKLRLRLAVPEVYSSAIPESSSISFTVDAQPTKKYSASLARKSNQIDLKTRTELWEFETTNKDKELKSGMYANASLTLRRAESTFAVPYSAVVTTLEKRFVILVRDGKAIWTDVRNGIASNDKVEVFGDLQEGDLILTNANDEIRSGSPILIKR
jgi:membrane fusion protein (multidrug efflux system)